jgi:hypothetical protein
LLSVNLPFTRRLSRYRLEWIVAVLLLMLLGVAMGYSMQWRRAGIVQDESEHLAAQARGVEDNLLRQLEGVDNALKGVIRLTGPGAPVLQPRELDERLQMLGGAIPGVRTIAMLDAEGTVVSAGRPGLRGRNFGHRAYFQVPQAGLEGDVLYVSAPIQASVDGLVVFVGRRRVDADGRFAGIVAATLDPDYFTVVMRSVLYAPDMRSLLLHGDGPAFLAVPHAPGLPGLDLRRHGSPLAPHLLSADRGVLLRTASPVDGQPAFVALRTIRGAPLDMDRPLVAVLVPPMALSRLVLGVHYPSDVIAGSLLGAAVAAGARRVSRRNTR